MLALAYKQLPAEMTPSELRHLPRDRAESELQFAGACAVHAAACAMAASHASGPFRAQLRLASMWFAVQCVVSHCITPWTSQQATCWHAHQTGIERAAMYLPFRAPLAPPPNPGPRPPS